MSRFIHGEFVLKIIGNILYAHAKGPFNVEFVAKFRAETEESASILHGTRWASIIVFEGDNLMPLDAEAIIVEALKKRVKHGMVASVAIFSNTSALMLQRMQITRIYEKSGVKLNFFESEDEGIAWLNQQL